MENKAIVEKILGLKKEKDIRIIGHFYTPEEVQPIADILSDSVGFFNSIKQIPDDKRDLMVLGPIFFAQLARTLLYGRDMTVYVPRLCECPVVNDQNMTFEKVLAFKEAHPGIPMVSYSTSPLNVIFLGDYLAMPGEVAPIINGIDAPAALYVGDGNCGRFAIEHCNKKVIPYPGNPFCNTYSSIDYTDIEAARKEHPDGCLLIHPECDPKVAALSDHSLGTGAMEKLIAESDDSRKFIIGAEVGFYHYLKRKFPNKIFIHLSPRLICNTFKSIRLTNVLDCLTNDKEVITVDPVLAGRIYDIVKNR